MTKTEHTFARILLNNKLISQNAFDAAIRDANEKGKWLPSALFEQAEDRWRLLEGISVFFGMPAVDLKTVNSISITGHLENAPAKLLEQHKMIPMFVHNHCLYLAVGDPTDEKGVGDMRFHFKGASSVQPVVADPEAIEHILQAHFGQKYDDQDVDVEEEEDEDQDDENDVTTANSPVARIVNRVIVDAVGRGASDIHFENMEKSLRIRCRFDGLLTEMPSVPKRLAEKAISRIKVMANMDISERRIPQDGRIRLRLPNRKLIDFRVNTCPTLHGEKIVMRVLEGSVGRLDVDNLGMDDEQKRFFLNAISKPYGLVLVTGPTGSGKTVTLYTALSILNKPEINISTVEDPVEITLPGINQVNVNPKVGLTFAEALRAFLRQDPDIIMVGEIRDLETAETAIKAAQTGHLVFSTLHTNDAPQTLNRLKQMGIEPFNIASSVLLVVAQRLMRKLCDQCKRPAEYEETVLRANGLPLDGVYYVANADGCRQCVRGYRGRTGVFQVLPVDESIQNLIVSGAQSQDIEKAAIEKGVKTLRMSAIEKVKQGVTSLEEANRVTLE